MNQGSYAGPERRAAQRWADGRLLAVALDEVDHGLLVVRHDLSVVFANQAARRVLAGSRVLGLLAGHLQPGAEAQRGALQAALQAASARRVRSLLRLTDDTGQEAQELSVSPLQEGEAPQLAGACLVKLGRSELASELSVMAFARLYQLSPREREVLLCLCSGLRPAEVAAALGLSLSTVRTHLHHLRRKAGVSTVLALLGKVSAVPSTEPALKPPPATHPGSSG